ncbi:C-type mannose receptor 2 [Amphibalanus amphitrite]|uniref:C-type mannose receptor 2 n=1 Tax=Amphibalanus amphitrite TaxID=1232801 RepID=A0A6A4VEV3_AMPAM|nr:C-type mannose receptor 2 [Amphibalanus amphitrite]
MARRGTLDLFLQQRSDVRLATGGIKWSRRSTARHHRPLVSHRFVVAMVVARVSLLAAVSLIMGLQLAAPSTAAPASGQDCPTGWEGPHRDICYRLSEDARSWTDAKANGCEALSGGAYLASVTYANKAFLSKQESIVGSDYYWVGLRSGDAEWNSGTAAAEPVDYTNWEVMRHQEPSGSRITNDDCVMVTTASAPAEFQPAGSWVDWDCDYQTPAICQVQQNSDGSCSDGWTSVGSDCYAMTEALSFSEAELACSTKMTGARLAAVSDYDTLSAGLDIGTAGYLWIGLRSTPAADGALRWLANGEEVSDTPWKCIKYDEPDSEQMGFEDADCVVVNGLEADDLYQAGAWSDYFCTVEYKYLCALQL